MSPLRSELVLAICRGWRTNPTTMSVVDKQASVLLDLVRSCALVFTATITRMLSTMMRGQVKALAAILAMNIARTSEEMLAGFRGESEKPQLVLEKVMLNVMWFIFAWFWFDKASSALLRFATQSVWTGIAQDYHFPLISNNVLITGSWFHELNLHLLYFISKPSVFVIFISFPRWIKRERIKNQAIVYTKREYGNQCL